MREEKLFIYLFIILISTHICATRTMPPTQFTHIKNVCMCYTCILIPHIPWVHVNKIYTSYENESDRERKYHCLKGSNAILSRFLNGDHTICQLRKKDRTKMKSEWRKTCVEKAFTIHSAMWKKWRDINKNK